MKDAALALLHSRKFLVYLLAATLGAALVASGKLTVDRFESFVSGLAGVLIAAIAYEDGQEKSGGGVLPVSGAPVPVVPPLPPLPPRPRTPTESSTRLAFASAFILGGVLVLFLFAGCAPAADAATDAAEKAYRTEQDACFDVAERDAKACPVVQPARDQCLLDTKARLRACRIAVQRRWGRA